MNIIKIRMPSTALLIGSLCLIISTLSFAIYAQNKVLSSIPAYSKIYDELRDPFKDAAAAIELAAKTNRQVLIEIGGNWCSWCHKMDTFLAQNPSVYQALHSQYVLLKINVSDVNENEAFMRSLPPVLGYPHMYVSTAKGKMLVSKDTGELLEAGNYSKQRWLTFLDEWSVDNTLAKALLNHTSTVNNK